MTARSLNTRTAAIAGLALGSLLTAGLSAMAEPGAHRGPELVAEATPDSDSSPEAVVLSAEAQVSAELAAEEGVELQRRVLEELDAQGATDFWVSFADRADLSDAEDIDDWAQRGQYVYDQLVETAQASQAQLTAGLSAAGVEFESFWIANTVLVRGADQSVLDGVLTQAEVTEVRADEPVELPDPITEDDGGASVNAVEWGIANIRADQVWDEFGVRGEGIVVGSIDTGVAYTHPALADQYRGNDGDGTFSHDYNWWDPSHVCPAEKPCDNNNHGTHTTGTMVGDDGAGNQIGVAPGAEWIAAKGCEQNTCSEAALLSSGQFMLAPTNLVGGNPLPELRPHVVNNSWGGSGGEPFFDPVVGAWVAAGIFPAFANGNSGPGCGSAESPGDGPDAYAVGAHDSNNQIAGFSSRGPGRDGAIKPDLSAPGVAVRSAVPGGYGLGSGTSMATPHLAGTIALMWSAAGQAGDIPATREALDATAIDTEDLSCGGTPADNNVYGQGRLDALAATTELAIHTGVTGQVTDATTSEPMAGVTITGAGQWEYRTNPDGRYTARVLPGAYALEFARFGYEPVTVPVEVTEAGFTTVDVELPPAPLGRLTGTVRDAASGHTVPGVPVTVLDVPAELTAITDANGGFEIPDIPAGTYQLRAAIHWAAVTASVTVPAGRPGTVELALPPPYGRVDRVSVASDGTETNAASEDGTMSADGRYVAFYSRAANLIDQAVFPGYNVYLHDRHTGVTELVAINENGEPANGDSWKPWISADGRYVAFFSTASNLVPDPPPIRAGTQSRSGIYLRDRLTGTVELLSTGVPGESAAVDNPMLSPDSRYLSFQSGTIRYVDPTGVAVPPVPVCNPRPELPGRSDLCNQVYVYDRTTGQTASTWETWFPGDLEPDQQVSRGILTPDGRHVAFATAATNLVDQETNRGPDVFVHDRTSGEFEWVSVLPAPGPISDPQISDDGRFVTYSRGFLQPSAVYDRGSGQTELLAVPVAGDPPLLFAFSGGAKVSGDGRAVAFLHAAATATELLPEASGYFVRRDDGQVERLVGTFDGSPWDLLADQRGPHAISQTGQQVLFSTAASNVVPGDANGHEDLYVAERDFDPDQSAARFAVWDLSVNPADPRPGQRVALTVKVKNVGDAAGAYPAVPLLDGAAVLAAARTETLAPGQTEELTVRLTVTEGGRHPVRIGQAAGELRVRSGTVTGSILDANDGTPVDGVTVTAVLGDSRRTATTIAGGAYQLRDLQLGNWRVTVEAAGYQPASFRLRVGRDGQQLTRDVRLRTGLAGAAPEAIALTVPAGSQATIDLKVSNTGTADLDWNAFGWAATAEEEPSILIYAHDLTHAGPDSYLDQALRRLGLDYTGFYGRTCPNPFFDPTPPEHDLEAFAAALDQGRWDLVLISQECVMYGIPPATLDALAEHVRAGGRLIIGSWQIRSDGAFGRDHPLWQLLGVRFAERVAYLPPSGFVYWWEPDHPVLDGQLTVPEFTNHPGQANRVEPVAGGTALAGYTTTPGVPEMAALVLGNDGRTLFRGFQDGGTMFPVQDGGNHNDLDRNGIPDGVELWTNSIAEVGGFSVRPWLTATGSGTLRPGREAELTVSVDARYLAPGSYSGAVAVVTDVGREPQVTVPVTLDVTPDACPDGYSAEENIVFGDRDSGVPNYDRGDGCTFLDLVWAEAPFADHGEFVRVVRDLSEQWRDDGLLTRREAQRILIAAAGSAIGRRGGARSSGLHTVV